MAKFAVALCILLVALGAQGDSSSIKETLESIASYFEQTITEKKEAWSEAMNSAQEKIESWVSDQKTQINEVVSSLNDKITELKEQGSTCISSNVDLESSYNTTITAVENCAASYLNELKSKGDELSESYEALKNDITSLKSQIVECTELSSGRISCLQELFTTAVREIRTDYENLANDAKEIIQKYEDFESVAKECASTSGLDALQAEIETAKTEIKACMQAS